LGIKFALLIEKGCMKINLNLVLFFLFITFSSFSQNDGDLVNYNKAKNLISEGKYQAAIDLLKPYTNAKKYGSLASYANFHLGHAYFQLGDYSEAIMTLRSLQNERTWQKKDDLHYLLALSYFKNQDFINALQEVAYITDEKIFINAENASYELLENASMSLLIPHLSKFSRNKGFLLALKEKMDNNIILSADEKVAQNTIKQISEDNKGVNRPTSTSNNQVLDVAVLLPFNHSGGRGVSQLQSNNFVFEFYQGLYLAVEELNARGNSISLSSFDTEKNVEKVNELLRNQKVANADVVIGPLYPEEIAPVIGFTEENKIFWVNPLSNVDEKLEQNQFSYLFRPSIKALSDGILEHIKFNLSGKRIAIGYSGVTRDEMLANNIKDFSSKYGIEVVAFKKISERDVRGFVSENSRSNSDAILLFTDDPGIAAPVFGLLESVSFSTPLFVMDTWLNFNFANYEMFNSQKLFFVGNNTVNLQSERTERFRNDFFQKFQMFPSINAHLGYEIIQWLTQTISPQVGFDLKKNLNSKGKFPGVITYGFDFKDSNSNKYIPVLKLINGELIVQ
jgi:tetratricopeptide (TPR) repeat protein